MTPDNRRRDSSVDRRTILKGAAISGGAVAGLSGTVTGHKADSENGMGDFYEVAVWIPHDLVRRTTEEFGDPWRAQKRAKTYIEGAFKRTKHKVEVKTPKIPVPNREHTNYGVNKKSICNHHEYPDHTPEGVDGWLLNVGWLRDWLESDCVPWEPAAHSNIMLTDGHNRGGGLAFGSGKYAVAATGRFVPRLPPEYQEYGYQAESEAIQAMWVTLHEMGHNLLQNGIDHDGDGVGHHDMASVFDRPEGNTVTALGLQGDVNNCGEQFDKSSLEGRELTYSQCSQDHFKPGFNSAAETTGNRDRAENVVDLEGIPQADQADIPDEVREHYG